MASGVFAEFKLITDKFNTALAEVDRVTDRTTLYALRATGRQVVRKARAKAPVLSGDLKKSISNSRVVTHHGTGDYSMKVGPFGTKKKGTAVARYGSSRGQVTGVPVYRGKQEERHHYMAAGFDGMASDMARIYEEAYAKGFERFR